MRKDLINLKQFNAPTNEFINLATNENSYLIWQELLKEDFLKIISKIDFYKYGDSKHSKLINKYASTIKVKPENLMCAAGSDSIIPLLINALTTNNILTIDTDFFRYSQAAMILNRNHIKVKLDDNVYTNIIKAVNDIKVDLIFLSNPNNPLGIMHQRKDIINILENTNCYVVIDEAYVEFADDTLVDLIPRYKKLIILRTMSKAWGLACLRIGFAVAQAQLIDYLKAVQGPFVLSDLNSNIATCALNHIDEMKLRVIEITTIKNNFIKSIEQSKLKIFDSNTNFVYIETKQAKVIAEKLKEHKILIALFENGIRITIGQATEMMQVSKIINEIMKEGL